MSRGEKSDKPKTKITFLELDKFLGSPNLVVLDSGREGGLDDIVRRLAEFKTRRLEMLELDKYLLEAEKEIEKLRRESEALREGGPSSSSSDNREEKREEGEITPEVAAFFAKLPEDQRQIAITVYALLKGLEKGKEALSLAYAVPLLAGLARQHNQGQGNVQVDLAKLAEALVKAMELGRGQQSYNPLDLLKIFVEVFKESIQRPLEEVAHRIQPQPSALEQVLSDDKLFERLKALLGGSGKAPPEMMLEIEKLRTERDLKLQELQLQHHRWITEQQLEQKKWEQIGRILEGPAGKFIEIIGRAGADRIRGYPQSVKMGTITCPTCNKQFVANVLDDYAVCPHCGALLMKRERVEGGEGTVESSERQAGRPAEEAGPGQRQ